MPRTSPVKMCNKCKQRKPRLEFLVGISDSTGRLEISQFCEACRTELATCSRCGQGKPVCEFNRESLKHGWCTACHRAVRHDFFDEMRKLDSTMRNELAEEVPARKHWYDQDPDDVLKLPDRRRRERLRAVPRERIDRTAIFERDGWICGICGEPVSPEDATIDHIVPIARGGHDTVSNVRLAHSLCNSRRGDGP